MLSPATLFLPGIEQVNTKEAEFCRKTSFPARKKERHSFEPQLHSHHDTRKKGFASLPGSGTPLHTPAENHFAESIYKCLTPGIELTLCKRHDKLQHVRKGQEAEYQMTEIAPSPSLFIVFL